MATAVQQNPILGHGLLAMPERPASALRGRAYRGLGLRAKLVLFLASWLAVLTAVACLVLTRSLEQSITFEVQSKGQAIAHTLANSGLDAILNRT